jgi:hypothetical protein
LENLVVKPQDSYKTNEASDGSTRLTKSKQKNVPSLFGDPREEEIEGKVVYMPKERVVTT